MRLLEAKRAALVLGCCATLAGAAVYTWTGGGADDDWDTCGNWTPHLTPCYPCDADEDATIPASLGGYDVGLITGEIKDLTVQGDATFGAAGGTYAPTMTGDTITITGGQAGTTVIVTDGATLDTQGC